MTCKNVLQPQDFWVFDFVLRFLQCQTSKWCLSISLHICTWKKAKISNKNCWQKLEQKICVSTQKKVVISLHEKQKQKVCKIFSRNLNYFTRTDKINFIMNSDEIDITFAYEVRGMFYERHVQTEALQRFFWPLCQIRNILLRI